ELSSRAAAAGEGSALSFLRHPAEVALQHLFCLSSRGVAEGSALSSSVILSGVKGPAVHAKYPAISRFVITSEARDLLFSLLAIIPMSVILSGVRRTPVPASINPASDLSSRAKRGICFSRSFLAPRNNPNVRHPERSPKDPCPRVHQ